MKKLLLAGLAVVMLSCKSPAFMVGMSETDFKQVNRSASLVSAVADGTSIYRTMNMIDQTYNFYYFYQNKMVRFEQSKYPEGYKFIR